jgi:hypothetical protein
MRFCVFLALVASIPAIVFGQADVNTITVTVSRTADQPLDQAVFSIYVNSAADQGLDDVVKALPGTGITASNLAQLYSYNSDRPQPLTWVFQWAAPLEKTPAAAASLTSLQRNIAQNNHKLSLSFSVLNAASSADPRRNCDFAALVADARAKAQELGGAGGFAAGAIAGVANTVRDAVADCSLTVTFALGYSGRPGPHTISIAAVRTASLPQDSVAVTLDVRSPLSASLADVTSALSRAGLAGATLTGVTTDSAFQVPPNAQRYFQWTFTQTVPLSKLAEALKLTANAQQTIAGAAGRGLDLAYRIDGVRPAPQTVASCRQADLIADAKTQAQRIANAAGVSLGSIVSISGNAQPANGYAVGGYAYFGFPSTFRPVIFELSSPAAVQASNPCAAVVQFQLY